MRRGRLRWWFIWLAVAAAGCHNNGSVPRGGWFGGDPPPMVLDGTRAEMRAEVLRHVPLGTRVEDARAVMEQNRFDCRASGDDSPQALICTKRQHAGPDVAFQWSVELRHNGQKVTGADVTMLGYGPERPEVMQPEESQPEGTQPAAGQAGN